jgi:hypothetical protein
VIWLLKGRAGAGLPTREVDQQAAARATWAHLVVLAAQRQAHLVVLAAHRHALTRPVDAPGSATLRLRPLLGFRGPHAVGCPGRNLGRHR